MKSRRALSAALAAVLGALLAATLGAGSVTAQTQQTTTTTTTTAATTTTAPTGPVYTATPPTNHVLYQDGQTGRYLLGGEWLYRADPTNLGIAQGWYQNNPSTLGWSPVTVPNADNAGNFSSASMDGTIGWYRRDFTLPANAFGSWVPNSDRDWIVRFESANYNATVWLNGHELGTHNVAYLPFEFNLGDLKAGVNRLIVRVDNIRTSADFPPGPGGIWWNFGGLLREVYLRTAARADLQQAIVRPILPCPKCAATIDEQALVRNVTTQPQTVQLTGTYGNQRLFFGEHTIAPGATWTATATALIVKPRLWSLDAPQLYKATMTLSDTQGRRLGGYVDYSGIRSITVVNGHLELNGRQLHIRGVNMHEQNVLTGAALSPTQLATLMGWIKELGATMIRAHYPLNPEIEEMADRDGILLWSEVPVYQINDKYFRQASWVRQALALVKANIETNQNHPSVAIWSIGNELPQTVDPGEARYISKAAALAHQLDPTRPVGLAIKDWPGLPCQAAQYAPLDVVGVNEYFGWFDVGGGVTDDRDALGPFLDTVHQCLPNKAIIITEFGVDANRPGPVEERGTYAFQANTAAYDLGVFAARPWLSGALYFLIQDYPAYPGYNGGNPLPSPPFNNKGLVDLYGNLKPAFAVVQSIYQNTVQIGHARDVRKVRSDQRQGLWAGGL
jgi:beta-glucuronidase